MTVFLVAVMLWLHSPLGTHAHTHTYTYWYTHTLTHTQQTVERTVTPLMNWNLLPTSGDVYTRREEAKWCLSPHFTVKSVTEDLRNG